MPPGLGNGREVKTELFFGRHQLKSFGVGLHQPVFHAVVHHLGEMTGSAGSDPAIALVGGRGQSVKDGLQTFDRGTVSADHQRVSLGQSPDAATGAYVDEVDPLGRQFLGAAHAVLIVCVSAIQDGIAGAEKRG